MPASVECAVWWAPVAAAGPALLEVLDEVERQRLHPLRRAADKARSALGAAMLRLAVEQHTGVPAPIVAVDRVCRQCGRPHGRPRLPGTALHASVSHAGDWVAVALSEVGEVGIDVQLETGIDVRALAGEVLASGEVLRDPRDFFICWARKEAVLKATGDGLEVPMAQVQVGPPQEPPALGSYPGRPGLVARLYDLTSRDRHVAALAVLTEASVRVTERDASPLLAAARRRIRGSGGGVGPILTP